MQRQKYLWEKNPSVWKISTLPAGGGEGGAGVRVWRGFDVTAGSDLTSLESPVLMRVLTPNLGPCVPRPGLCQGCSFCGISLLQISSYGGRETLRGRVQEGEECLIPRHSKCLEHWRSILHDFLGSSGEIKKAKGL